MEDRKYTDLGKGWMYRWVRIAPGKNGRKMAKGRNPSEVEERAAEIEGATKTASGPKPGRTIAPGTFAEFFYSTYFPRVARNAAPTTKKLYNLYFRKHILPVLGNLPIASIGYDEVEGLLNALGGKDRRQKDQRPLSAKTRREIVMRVKELLRLYVDLERSRGNAARDDWKFVEPPKAPKKKEREEAPDDFTVRLLTAAAGTWLEGPLFCILFLALRRGEVAGMRARALDRKNLRVRVLEQAHPLLEAGALPKGGKTRDIPVPEGIMDAIERLRDRSGVYLWTCEGRPVSVNSLSKRIPELCVAAGLPRKTPHDLRSLAASNLVAMGADLAVVMEILGHAQLPTSLIYIDPKAAHKREALARLIVGKPVDEAADAG